MMLLFGLYYLSWICLCQTLQDIVYAKHYKIINMKCFLTHKKYLWQGLKRLEHMERGTLVYNKTQFFSNMSFIVSFSIEQYQINFYRIHICQRWLRHTVSIRVTLRTIDDLEITLKNFLYCFILNRTISNYFL